MTADGAYHCPVGSIMAIFTIISIKITIGGVCRSYRGHHDANFNVAILDGHKEIVAHEKFQQLLHKKWGQRDKIHYGDDIRLGLTTE